ncbi:glycosyltransferase [Micromonospora sp. NPDC050417]|uniref:glycosyltransferase family 2 protein n=1 Tax=Micromonospora sp. NPDC050417 TaxID=3364280 RepID=UPI0037AB216B
MTTPALSVVIPVLDNGHLLHLTLDALTRQTLPRDRFEVIVVDDGSDPPLRSVTEQFDEALTLTYLRQDNKGRSVARNRALDAARGDVVVFLDADQSAHPDLLLRHWQFHHDRGHAPGVLLGRAIVVDWAAIAALRAGTLPSPEMLGDYREDVRDALFAVPHHRRDFHRAPWVYSHTNNASVDRASLTAVGGFDEQLTTWGGEDNELFYRIFHHHGRDPRLFDLADDAVSYDLPHFRVWPLLMAQLAENYQVIARKHPRYDIEFFGVPGLWTTAVRRIVWFEDTLRAARANGLARVDRLPAAIVAGLENTDSLVIGFGATKLQLGPDAATFDHDAPASERNLHLAGLRTPFPDGHFGRVVTVDLWRFLTPEDLGSFLFEALRIGGGTVDFVCTDLDIDPVTMLPLPFVGDLGYLRTTVEPHLPVSVDTEQGCTTLRIRAGA